MPNWARTIICSWSVRPRARTAHRGRSSWFWARITRPWRSAATASSICRWSLPATASPPARPSMTTLPQVDVAGKAAVMLRHQPRDEVDDKASAPIKETAYTAFRHKASNASEHDASAVIFCSDQAELRRRRSQDDTLLSFHVAGTTFTHPDLPVITCRRAVIDNILRDLNEPQLGRDRRPDRPHAQAGQPRTQGLADSRRDRHAARALRSEECGRHSSRRRSAGRRSDRAGCPLRPPGLWLPEHVALQARARFITAPTTTPRAWPWCLEVARALAQRPQKLRRTVIFIFFTGEEWGFWGSSYYVNDPIVPISKTAAMVNLDMVGRLREDALTVNSVGTGTGFSELLDQLNRPYGFHLTKVGGLRAAATRLRSMRSGFPTSTSLRASIPSITVPPTRLPW